MGGIGVLQVKDIYCFTIRVAAPMMTADTSLKSPTWNRLRRPPEGHIYKYILHTTMEGHTCDHKHARCCHWSKCRLYIGEV